MKKTLFVLLSTLILFSACGKKLKNTERFLGDYNATVDVVLTVTVETVLGNISNDITEVEELNFSIMRGDEDDKVIVFFDKENIVNATIEKNKIILDEIVEEANFELPSMDNIGVSYKVNIVGDLVGDDITLYGDINGAGQDDNTNTSITFSGDISGKAEKQLKNE